MKKILILFITFTMFFCLFTPAFALTKDTTPPIIKALNPSNNKINVSISQTITITFNENIFKGKTFSNITLVDSNEFKVGYKAYIIKNLLSIKTNINLNNNTNYKLVIPIEAIADPSGNSLKKSTILYFKTIEASIARIPTNIEYNFEILKIDNILAKKMTGVTYLKNNSINLNDLRLLKLTYWGFDDTLKNGEIIVNKFVAKDVVNIFIELYDKRYPIDKVNLMDTYFGNDSFSMSNNNTSAFNYRTISGTKKISNHAYGLAIDINPIQNPYVEKDLISPEEGKNFLNRKIYKKGMIIKNDDCYKAFVSRGWAWGGDWNTKKDYQHFEILIKGINL